MNGACTVTPFAANLGFRYFSEVIKHFAFLGILIVFVINVRAAFDCHVPQPTGLLCGERKPVFDGPCMSLIWLLSMIILIRFFFVRSRLTPIRWPVIRSSEPYDKTLAEFVPIAWPPIHHVFTVCELIVSLVPPKRHFELLEHLKYDVYQNLRMLASVPLPRSKA
jgi:hypothetical protein